MLKKDKPEITFEFVIHFNAISTIINPLCLDIHMKEKHIINYPNANQSEMLGLS